MQPVAGDSTVPFYPVAPSVPPQNSSEQTDQADPFNEEAFLSAIPDGAFDANTFEALFAALGMKDTTPQKEAVESAKKAEYKKELYRQLPHLVKMSACACKKGAEGYLELHPRLFDQHQNLPVSKLLHSCFQDVLPLMRSDVEPESLKIEFYEMVVNMLQLELDLIRIVNKQNVNGTRVKIFQDLIFETTPVQFMGNLFLMPLTKNYDLSSTEAFAFYLRFTKKLGQTQQEILPYMTPKDVDVFKCLQRSDKPGIKAQMSHLAAFCQLSGESELTSCIEKELIPILRSAQSKFSNYFGFEVGKRLVPALAFLSVIEFDMAENCSGIGTYNPKTDLSLNYYLPLRKKFMEDLSAEYVEKQSAIYQKAYGYLQDLLKANPQSNTKVAGELTPEEYKKAFQSEIKTNSQDAQQPQIDLSKKADDEWLEEESKQNVKKKKNISRKKHVRAAKVEDVKRQIAPETPKKTVSLLATTVNQTLQSPHPLRLHGRVKRWIDLAPSQLSEIKKFTDFRDGKEVRSYEKLEERELRTQLVLHGFSPLVDKILGHADLREKYTYKTERGVAVFLELIKPGEPVKRAVLCYGLDNRLCFHRKIDFKTDKEFQEQTFDQLARRDDLAHEASQNELIEELSSGFEGDVGQLDDALEIIKFIDRKNGCQINVFPLK